MSSTVTEKPSAVAKGTVAQAAGLPTALPIQYLTFTLASETFAIGILSVKEIIEYRGVTEVPMMPSAIRGVINLRGAVVPVLDLLARFGKPSSPVGKRTCIVIVEVVTADDERQVIGVIVDAVSEVIDIPATDIEPPPSFGARVSREFIAGMGKVRGKFVILLDAARVLATEELHALTENASTPAAAEPVLTA